MDLSTNGKPPHPALTFIFIVSIKNMHMGNAAVLFPVALPMCIFGRKTPLCVKEPLYAHLRGLFERPVDHLHP